MSRRLDMHSLSPRTPAPRLAVITLAVSAMAVIVSLAYSRLPSSQRPLIALALAGTTLGVAGWRVGLRGVPPGSRTRHLLLLLVMLGLPLVKWRGPGNTSIADLPAMLLIAYSTALTLRCRRLVLPDKGSFISASTIILGGTIALFASPSVARSVLTLVQDISLLLFWAAVLNLRARSEDRCGSDWTTRWLITAWVAVAVANSLLMLAGRLVQADAVARALGYGGGTRGVGLFRDPNMAGHYAGASLFAVPLAYAYARRGVERAAYVMAALILLAGLLATGSNGAKAGLISGVGATSAVWALRGRMAAYSRIALLLALLTIFVASFLASPDDGISRLQPLSEHDPLRLSRIPSTLQERIAGWQRALGVFLAAPLGVGPGIMGAVPGDAALGRSEAHNDLLCVLAERGVIGALGYVCFVIAVLRQILAWAPGQGQQPSAFGLSLAGVFTFMFVMGLSVDSLHFRHLWFLAGLYLSRGRVRATSLRW